MSVIDLFRSKTPPPATACRPIAVPAKKPIDVAERDEAIEALGELNAALNENDLVIARAQDKRRRLLLAIEGRKAQLDVHERPEREMLNKVADTFDAAFSDLPDISTAIADAPDEMKVAAE